ncbi:MAG: SMP-30/gluconolactonase/LRE family protein, partial [Ruegeria sp.]
GELCKLLPNVTISNSICFAHNRQYVYYSDTITGRVMRWRLNQQTGWPEGSTQIFLDLRDERLNPDGAVVDASGNIWIAQWGAARVASYDSDGQFVRAISFDAAHTSCPAFGGDDLTTLYCTTAREMLDAETLKSQPTNGMTFAAVNAGHGQPEHRVIL